MWGVLGAGGAALQVCASVSRCGSGSGCGVCIGVYTCVCVCARSFSLSTHTHFLSLTHTHSLSHTHDAHNAHAEMKLSKDGSGAVGWARGDSQVGHRGENERERERESGTGGDSGQDSLAAEKRKQKSWENWLPIPGNLDNLPHNRA